MNSNTGATIAGLTGDLVDTQELEGVGYELYATEKGGAVRVVDTDVNEVVTIRTYPSFLHAEAAYLQAVT